MTIIGVIAEYNPFHNGHIYHINKIKELYPDSLIIAVINGNYVQRGSVSIIDKWDKTSICLNHNIDLVIELPFVFGTQSADIFAKGSIQILNYLKVDKIIFGSETNDINKLNDIVDYQLSKEYQDKVNSLVSNGLSYPMACSKALNIKLKPNDILGISYIREAKKMNSNIIFETIKRTNDYNSKELEIISSASSIRESFVNNININNSVPKDTLDVMKKKIYLNDDYFQLLKYKIITSKDLSIYKGVDEGIENKLIKNIDKCNNFDELIMSVKSKRYTYARISRMLIHILTSFTKEEDYKDIKYIRVLGFNSKGRKYLNKIKKDINIPILSKYDKLLELERRVSHIYYGKDIEYKKKVIIK
jgi:predicted nucleotidyltransferase